MKIPLLTLSIMLLASNVALSQQPGSPPTEHTVHAQGSGCVRPAREKGCFVLHDIRRRRYWDLGFNGDNRPDVFTHIWFEGIGYSHDAHCSQGNPVHVTSWKVLPGECDKPAEPKESSQKPQ